MDDLPDKLTWENCSCGHHTCKRSYPSNMGTFYMGSGFEPNERAAIDRAWSLLMAEKREAE